MEIASVETRVTLVTMETSSDSGEKSDFSDIGTVEAGVTEETRMTVEIVETLGTGRQE